MRLRNLLYLTGYEYIGKVKCNRTLFIGCIVTKNASEIYISAFPGTYHLFKLMR